MFHKTAKDAARVNKLKGALSAVVILYLLYAVIKDGMTPFLMVILAAAVVVGVMQLWMHTASYQNYKEKQRRMDKK